MNGDEDVVVSLLSRVGPRPVPPAFRTTQARAAVEAAWRAGVRRRRSRRLLLYAAAVALACAAGVLLSRSWDRPAHEPAGVVADVARLDRGGLEREDASGWTAVAAGEALVAGSRLRAKGEGAALRLERGRSVRLAADARVRVLARDRLLLEAGTVYVDSGQPAVAPSAFEVQTRWGSVRETGTQFEVRLEPAALRVRVREGRVAVLGPRPTLDAAAGTELRVAEEGVTRLSLPAHGPEWAWVLALAPAFEIEGRSLHDVLAWSAREAGWDLRYADDASRHRAEGAVLHGSIRGLRADQAPDAVVATTGLTSRLDGGVLRVGPAD